MPKILATFLLGSLTLAVGPTHAETEIVPFDRKPGEGYLVDPQDHAANLAICGSRCDDQDSSRQGYVTNGGWRPIAERPEAMKIFIVNDYAYDFAHNPDAPPKAQAVCGSHCNILSDNLKSYTTPMGWRLIKNPVVQTRVINLDTPEIKGECLCRGDEYLVEPEFTEKR